MACPQMREIQVKLFLMAKTRSWNDSSISRRGMISGSTDWGSCFNTWLSSSVGSVASIKATCWDPRLLSTRKEDLMLWRGLVTLIAAERV